METIIMYPKSKKQQNALEAIAKALRIDYELNYDQKFVDKILQGREDVKNGKGIKIAIEDLWNNLITY